jgi:hypothetical protein
MYTSYIMYTIQGFGSLYCVAHHVLGCVYIHTSWKSALRASRKSLSNPGENLSDRKVSNSSCSFSNTGPSSSSSFMPSRVRKSYHFNEVFIIFSLAFRLFFFLLNNPLLKFHLLAWRKKSPPPSPSQPPFLRPPPSSSS